MRPYLPLQVAIVAVLLLIAALAKCAHAETGVASYYGSHPRKERLNRHTANGEVFNPNAMTCASRRHKSGVRLKVTHLRTGRSIVCRVNDYGPSRRTGRILDLSHGAARKLGIERQGVARVRIEVVR